jgi:hypothetical protein
MNEVIDTTAATVKNLYVHPDEDANPGDSVVKKISNANFREGNPGSGLPIAMFILDDSTMGISSREDLSLRRHL